MKNNKTFFIVTAIAVVVCIVALIIVQQKYKSLRADYMSEQDKSAQLASQLKNMRLQNEERLNVLTEERDQIREDLEMKTETVTTQTKANIKIKRALQSAQARINEAEQLNEQLEEKLQSGDKEYASLKETTASLKDSLRTLAAINQEMEAELEEAILKTMDETMITAVKRNEKKLTTKARKVRKLFANVEVPGKYDNIHFNIVAPDGNEISDKSSAVSSRVLPDAETFVASAREEQNLYPSAQKFQVTYVPEDRLEPGVYTIEIYNDSLYVGSMQVKLR